MSLYEQWINRAFTKEGRSVDSVWEDYLPKEQRIYEYILGNKITKLDTSVEKLGKQFSMTAEEIIAFVDGINDILPNSYDCKKLDENSDIHLDIDFAKLYKKMVEFKAEHLCKLPQWDDIFTPAKRKELVMEQRNSRTIIKEPKIGRNDPCPCGSGKKYKKCCGANL